MNTTSQATRLIKLKDSKPSAGADEISPALRAMLVAIRAALLAICAAIEKFLDLKEKRR